MIKANLSEEQVKSVEWIVKNLVHLARLCGKESPSEDEAIDLVVDFIEKKQDKKLKEK